MNIWDGLPWRLKLFLQGRTALLGIIDAFSKESANPRPSLPIDSNHSTMQEQREAAVLEFFREKGPYLEGDETIEDIHENLRHRHPELFSIAPASFKAFWKKFIKAHPEYRLKRGPRPKWP